MNPSFPFKIHKRLLNNKISHLISHAISASSVNLANSKYDDWIQPAEYKPAMSCKSLPPTRSYRIQLGTTQKALSEKLYAVRRFFGFGFESAVCSFKCVWKSRIRS
ncbi:unnamed protein product [Albugo candida]|uniref:Uncharacterized protein n=1 Tax=Albugo candida TaxID=65357 RepID=A0A024FWZ9_9STRA|nr:unnamed protein product [Albugo candida]|eukprot:CCI11645.1 unnamed protein product [Albugo candida]